MRIVFIADSFPPERNSAAVQIRDLTRELISQGHELTIILPNNNVMEKTKIEFKERLTIVRLRAPKTKNVNNIRRAINEFMLPIFMMLSLYSTEIKNKTWEGVIWYSPTIFHGFLVNFLKKRSKCKSYLIIRDIFPEWALDLGIIRKGLPYYLFKLVANYQYKVADVIGVQTQGNLQYFENWNKQTDRKLEVLPNWLGEYFVSKCSIQICKTKLKGRKIFVYAGNMGVAQSVEIFLDLAKLYNNNHKVGFLFVGRGSEIQNLKVYGKKINVNNVLFFDEIEPQEIPGLYAQCDIGLVALSAKHKSHNIPGKFLTYLQNGLPCLANINAGNDLAEFIRLNNVGYVCETNSLNDLFLAANKLLLDLENEKAVSERCKKVFASNFSTYPAAKQITAAIQV